MSGFDSYRKRAIRNELLEELHNACNALLASKTKRALNLAILRIQEISADIAQLPPPDKTHSAN